MFTTNRSLKSFKTNMQRFPGLSGLSSMLNSKEGWKKYCKTVANKQNTDTVTVTLKKMPLCVKEKMCVSGLMASVK